MILNLIYVYFGVAECRAFCPMTFQANVKHLIQANVKHLIPLEKLVVCSVWGNEMDFALYGAGAMKRAQILFEQEMKLCKKLQEKGMMFLVTNMDMETELINQCRKDKLLTLYCSGMDVLFETQTFIWVQGSLITRYEPRVYVSVTLQWSIGEDSVSITSLRPFKISI